MTAGDCAPTGLEFDQVAQRYDRIRPDYPAELFDALTALTGIGSGSELLEVGSGTGKATVPLAARGCRITCLEPGRELAAVAAARLGAAAAASPGRAAAGQGQAAAGQGQAAAGQGQAAWPGAGPAVQIVPGRFEDFEPAGRRFDLVYAATSWHWTDPAVRYAKAAALLRPGGALAIWSAGHGFPPGYDSFFDEIQPAYAALGPAAEPPLPPDEVPDLAPEIQASGLFGPVTVRRFGWALPYTADSYIELVSTFSSHLVMAPAARDELFARIRELIARRGGTITRHWLAILHVTRLLGHLPVPCPEPERPRRT